MTATAPVFSTPEEIAPTLGMRPAELRRYCRESGICTRLSKNRMMLHADDVTRLISWVRKRNTPTPEQAELDPFA